MVIEKIYSKILKSEKSSYNYNRDALIRTDPESRLFLTVNRKNKICLNKRKIDKHLTIGSTKK